MTVSNKVEERMKICAIASGSSGNCIYAGSGDTHLLIDAGISRKKITKGLENLQVEPERIDGLLLTHEHSDHISGLRVWLKKYPVPVYGTRGTLQAVLEKDTSGEIPRELLHEVIPDREVRIKDMRILPFSTSHDAAEPVGYTIESQGHKMGLATDLGTYSEYTLEHLQETELLFLEANHDVTMLEVGSYPYQLKKRILSDKGHLSNIDSGELLCKAFSEKMKHIILAHLSKEHNYPELAYQTVKSRFLMEHGNDESILPDIKVAKRDVPSEVVLL